MAAKALVTDLTWGLDAATQDRTVALAKDSGAEWIRVGLGWYWTDDGGVPGGYGRDMFQAPIKKAKDAGLKVLATISQTPLAESRSGKVDGPPKDNAKFAAWAKDMATRYPNVDAWQVWNEPNLNSFWPTSPNASEYAALLQATYQAVKPVVGTKPVIAAGLSENDVNYLKAMLNAGTLYADAIATHPYCGGSPDTDPGFLRYRELHALAPGLPIWFTEMGWATHTGTAWPVTEQQQADYITKAYQVVDPYVTHAFVYCLRNDWWDHDANSWGAQLGLVKTDFTPKKGYTAFKFVAAATPAPTPAPTPTPTPNPAPPNFWGPTRVVDKLPADGRPYEQIGHKNGNTYSWNPSSKSWQRLNP